MFRRNIAAAVVLLILFLVACHKKDSQDLFLEQTGGQITEDAGSKEEAGMQEEAGSDRITGTKASIKAGENAKTNTQVKAIAEASAESIKEASNETSTKANIKANVKANVKVNIKANTKAYTKAVIKTEMKKVKAHSKETNAKNIDEQFYYEKLSAKVKSRINGKSYGKNCDIPYEELRYVRVLYWGFDKESHKGELIVNRKIANDMVAIFKELYKIKYPIEKMVLVDEYDADDNASMAADNTSSFNYRRVDKTEHLSQHSYGLAIDINPRYNPYIKGKGDNQSIAPENGIAYADRSLDCKYYIKKGDPCYKAFKERGFTWGGEWKNLKDYQHFQKKE